MKIDFCPNKRRLILLSCPLQLISIDSRSPSGLRSVSELCELLPHAVSIHAAQAGCDRVAFEEYVTFAGFQFTQPKRAATSCWSSNVFRRNVSIHAAQAGCDEEFIDLVSVKSVSIHAAQAGCDTHLTRAYDFPTKFQFTQPKRAATCTPLCQASPYRGFNSRSPSGLRLLYLTK